MKKPLCGFLLLVSALAYSMLVSAASVTLGQAGFGGVSAIISPDPGEVGQRANIWMGGVLNGALYLRNGPSTWVEYRGGPLPIAQTSAALPSSLQVSIVNFDISSLLGLDVYVGYGSTEADLLLSGHLAKVYTVPTTLPHITAIHVQPIEQVLAPNGASINTYHGLASLSDEHSTIFPPGTFPGHQNDYLFFIASKSVLNGDSTPTTGNTSGLEVLTSIGPNASGQWTLDFAQDYGRYGNSNGQVFIAPMDRQTCPNVALPALQDQTFDLNYANAGSVVIDPTNPGNFGPGNLLMVYEGTNTCVGVTGTNTSPGNFYAALGIATSNDNGKTWPSYRANGSFAFTPLPQQNMNFGPNVSWTSFGVGGPVCMGNDCTTNLPSPLYGRYGVLSPVVSIPAAAAAGPLAASMGNAEPSAFVDQVGSATAGGTYLYVVHGYESGAAGLGAPHANPKSHGEIMVSRALLGGTSKLSFTKWFGNSVSYGNTAAGSFALTTYSADPTLQNNGSGVESAIFPMQPGAAAGSAAFLSCQARDIQGQVGGSISYVEETHEYLMIFVCRSPSEPNNPQNTGPGLAWFYSTLDATQYDLSHQDKWSTPREIDGSWEPFGTSVGCPSNSGNYPSIMSLGVPSGHLSTSGGYVFSLKGCPGGGGNEIRQYSSRRFTVTTQ